MKSSPTRKYENFSDHQAKETDKYSLDSQDTASLHSNAEEGGRRGAGDVNAGAGDMWISAVESSILSWEELTRCRRTTGHRFQNEKGLSRSLPHRPSADAETSHAVENMENAQAYIYPHDTFLHRL
ncbi:jg16715 [Pararge aegeria aegeria]|uniref:Jg16715 protein n=1 Tax=Pararge aegeria aegeria TaxID=348720 RepID=A0A8S4S5K8_9NEOP|nr:jg16715 [Pararge aegeria aegeria]